MSLLTLFQLNLAGGGTPLPPTVLPQHAFAASGRTRAFTASARVRGFAASARVRDFTAGS